MEETNEFDLPDEASALTPERRKVLGHPIRRKILRALNRGTDGQTLSDLSEAVSQVDLSTISYHVLVLETGGCISVYSEVVSGRGGMERVYGSNVADDRIVLEVLGATEQRDSEPR